MALKVILCKINMLTPPPHPQKGASEMKKKNIKKEKKANYLNMKA